MARGYFTNEGLESDNVPDELRALGVTKPTSDHNDQITDYGFEVGGPILPNRAWFFGSYSQQDVRLVRRSGNLIDRTILNNPNLKVNWQATKKAHHVGIGSVSRSVFARPQHTVNLDGAGQ